MGKIYLENDHSIKQLLPITIGRETHKISKGSNLFLKQTPTSMRFIWRPKGKDIPLGVWNNNTHEMLVQVKKAKQWVKKNPDKDPALFFKPEPEKNYQSLHDAWSIYWKYYCLKSSDDTIRDRRNKWKILLDYYGKNRPIKDFEIANGGKKLIREMQEKLFFDRRVYSEGKRNRSIMKGLFEYAIHKEWIDSNPAIFAHPDEALNEALKHTRKERNQHIKWKEVEYLLSSISDNFSNYKLTDLATKAHMLMAIRSGVIVRLQWSWYDKEEDLWTIPAQTPGLKNLKHQVGKEYDHKIPSTPEINRLMEILREINGSKKHVFHSSYEGKNPHLGEGIINDQLMEISGKRQSGHGWRDVFVEGTQVGGFKQFIIDRCIGHKSHKQGSWGHYDEGEFLPERKKCMEWWTKELVNKGLKI